MKPLRIAQISDFHFSEITLNPFRLFSKRFLGLLNWIFFRRGAFTTKSVEELPSVLKELAIDQILLGGDFTSTALPAEFARARAFIDRLPAPWIAIPGNHDHYTYRAHRQKHYYQAIQSSRKADLCNLAEDGVEARRIGDRWWVVSLDTARATNLYSSRGLFSPQLEARLKTLLDQIPSDHSILLFNHYPFFQHDTHRHTLKRGDRLEQVLRADPRIKAYLHGHTHQHIIADLQPSGLPLILDSGCVADERNGSWNLLSIDDRGIQIDVYRWNNGWSIKRKEAIAWTR